MTDSSTGIDKEDVETEKKQIPTKTHPSETIHNNVSSFLDKLISRDHTKFNSSANKEKPSNSNVIVPPNSLPNVSSPSSPLTNLFGKKTKPVKPTELDLSMDNHENNEEKKNESPSSFVDVEQDTSDIKTPALTPSSPVKPLPTVIELQIPPSPAKTSTGRFLNFFSVVIKYFHSFLSRHLVH